MTNTAVRRISFFVAMIIAIALVFFSFNLIRFSSNAFLAEALPGTETDAFINAAQRQRFGTTLTWQKPTFETDDYLFTADFLTARFNLLSVAMGQPNLQIVSVESPYVELFNSLDTQTALRKTIRFGFQQLNATNGLVVTDSAEWQNLELSLLKNGVFGEYAVQASGEWVSDERSARLGLSTLIGIDGDDKLVFGKSQVDANVTVPNWTGRFAGKIKTARLRLDDEWTLKFVNWSSNWKTNLETFDTTLDWAGGLTEGQFDGESWTLNTLDTAIAYRDSKDIAHTFAIQSNESTVTGSDLVGQLGVSLLTEFPTGSPWQSFNLVLSGRMAPEESILRWNDANIRLSFIDSVDEQQTHYFDASVLNVVPEASQWTLQDGEWRHVIADQQVGDYGFSLITGEFPSMAVASPPFLTTKLQPAFDLIAPDIETLDALFTHLVP